MHDEPAESDIDEESEEEGEGPRRVRTREDIVAEREAKKVKLRSDIAKAAGSELTGSI
jgi:hypothetical protein